MIAGFILVAGTIQLGIYRKYSTELEDFQVPRSKLYHLQIFLTLFLPILEIARFALQATLFNDKNIYGYMVSKNKIIVIKAFLRYSTICTSYFIASLDKHKNPFLLTFQIHPYLDIFFLTL